MSGFESERSAIPMHSAEPVLDRIPSGPAGDTLACVVLPENLTNLCTSGL